MNAFAYYPFFAHPVFVILLVILLILALPHWPYARSYGGGVGWGYSPIGIIILILLLLLLLGGCEYTANGPQVKGSAAAHVRSFMSDVEPGIRPSVRLSATFYLDYATSPADRADLKANVFTASTIAASITEDTTPGQLSKAIQAALPAGQENQQLADAIAGSWGIAVPFVRGDPALVLKWVQDIAGGLADATK